MSRISSTALILVAACATYAATLSHTFFNTQPKRPTEPEPGNHTLKKVFDSVINGDWQLNDALIPHFVKSISTHPDPAACLHALVTSEHGLKAVQNVVSSDPSSEFLDDSVATFLAYLRDSKPEYFRGRDTLQRLLRALVEAPGFWNSFATAFSKGKLQRSAEHSFSWLFLQLVVSPPQLAEKFRRTALGTEIVQSLLRSLDPETRSNARKINHIVSLFRSNDILPPNWPEAPGWRHDNDPRSYLDVSILPTPDEINSTERPSLRTVGEIDRLDLTSPIKIFKAHVENQFRLLREDLVRDTRDNVQVLFGKKKGKRTGVFIEGISLTKIYTNERSKWGLEFDCKYDLPIFSSAMDEGDRKDRLERDRNFLRHGSFACLHSKGEVVAFVTIVRDIDLLVRYPPVIVVQLGGRQSAKDALYRLHRCPSVSLAQINTPFFAYEPVLRGLQAMAPARFLLSGALLTKPHIPRIANGGLSEIDQTSVRGLMDRLGTTSKGITLDDAQTEAFICGLTQKVALIQGPPGTGKSFIGALLVKAFHETTNHKVLVCCYTNHALDQFLEDLLKQGIPEDDIVRLGSKPSPTTQSMALATQTHGYRFSEFDWEEIDEMRFLLRQRDAPLQQAFSGLIGPLSPWTLLRYLELIYPTYFEALSVPPSDDDMVLVGESGRPVDPGYLLSRWLDGRGAGVLHDHPNVIASRNIWELSLEERKLLEAKWSEEILEARTEAVLDAGDKYNSRQASIGDKFQQRTRQILRSKRIIACTTTGASIFRDAIHDAGPEILVVEEAGEVLESHVLTALSNNTQRLILIGDHKQLRPKVNSYELTVEKGDGYDLNRSLFERLIIEGHPYRSLSKQHRMRPEISALVRALTYPNLTDGPRTGFHPLIRGLQNTVIFIDHKYREDNDSTISDPRHLGVTTSKRNKFEVDMVVIIVEYLKQQGYGAGEMTVLTPYLSQLVSLRETLETFDQVMYGEMDAKLLEVAGLAELLGTPAPGDRRKQNLKVSTIDNYQGEENDIIIASLTRSNEEGNIGFMSSPERLNVLLSRARIGLIIIGNSDTFLRSQSGKELWTKFFDMIKKRGHFYEGLPVRCDRHSYVKNVVRSPEDFSKLCTDGGCSEPCGVVMSCGIHTCPRKCHKRKDHEDIVCTVKVQMVLSCGHSITRSCDRSKGSLDGCIACKPLAQRKAANDKWTRRGNAKITEQPVSVGSRTPAPPTSSWRDRHPATTTDSGDWRSRRSTSGSTTSNAFNTCRGPRQSGDTYKDGLFSRQKPQCDSSFPSRGDSSSGSWRR